ncbi:MAG: pilus assembly protein N-terminal domain-containing protein [Alphaproteobacteria bacterium]
MIKINNSKTLAALAVISVFGASPYALADNNTVDILPPVIQSETPDALAKETHPTVNLTPDKSELIHIEEEIGSIIIGSPAHINVLADSAHTLVIVPRKPGATHFSVLDKKGKILMQRHVIVAAPTEDYLRVKRTCTDKDCEDTSIYYCPDMCHQVETPIK